MSGDPDQQYFTDGTDCGHHRSAIKVSDTVGDWPTSLTLRGREAGALNGGKNFSADYVLTGNIRKSANRVRIAARLNDVRTQGTLWADHYDRILQDVFVIQDEIANIIASTLMGQIEIEVASP